MNFAWNVEGTKKTYSVVLGPYDKYELGYKAYSAINNGMRDVFDFWNNKTPEDGSVDDVLRILEGIAPLLSEAKDKLNKT